MKQRIFDPSKLAKFNSSAEGDAGPGDGGSKIEDVEVEPMGIGNLAAFTPNFAKDHIEKALAAFKNLPFQMLGIKKPVDIAKMFKVPARSDYT